LTPTGYLFRSEIDLPKEDIQRLEDIGENFRQEHLRHPRMIFKDNPVHLSHCCTVVMIDGENYRLSETHRFEIIRQQRTRNECGNNEGKFRQDLIAAIE
jgi:cobalamin-dependent methionine synthase I